MNQDVFLDKQRKKRIGRTSRKFGPPSKFALFVCFLLFFSKNHAQDTLATDSSNTYKLLFQLELDAVQFTTDKLQNIYFISQKNEVVKLMPDGAEQFRFINKTIGQPTYLDATNPFNLLLFYPDYQNIITLDRTMNLAGQFNLFQLGLFGNGPIGMAGDGNLWAYDVVNFRLKKIGQNGSAILQSANLGLELGRAIQPNFLIERNQLVYLNDPASGILVFDVFGKYLKTLPIHGLDRFQVVGDELLFCKQGKMHSFHLRTLLQNPVLLPKEVSEESQLRVEKDRLYVLEKGLLKVYQF